MIELCGWTVFANGQEFNLNTIEGVCSFEMWLFDQLSADVQQLIRNSSTGVVLTNLVLSYRMGPDLIDRALRLGGPLHYLVAKQEIAHNVNY